MSRLRTALRRMPLPLLAASGIMPLALLANARWTVFYACAYLLLTLCAYLAPGRARLPVGLAACAAIAAAGIRLEDGNAVIGALLYAALVPFTLPAAPAETQYRKFMAVGLAGILIQLLPQTLRVLGNGLSDARRLTWQLSFLVFAVTAALSLNRGSLGEAGTSGQTPSRSMRGKNRRATLAVTAIAVVTASIPVLSEALRRFGAWLRAAVAAFFAWLNSLMPKETAAVSQPASSELGLGIAPGEPSPFWEALDKILLWVCGIVATVAAVFLLYIIARKLAALARAVMARLRAYGAAASADYVDEVADTRSAGEIVERVAVRLRTRRRPRRTDTRGLEPRARIRADYQALLSRHEEWPEGSTARENLSDGQAASLYEKARYSTLEVRPDEAEAFAERAGTLP